MLAAPLNVLILRALESGPTEQARLRRETGAPALTTLRTQLKRLCAIGALEKHPRNRFPGNLVYELTPAGQGLLTAIAALERWLDRAPDGPLALGSTAAKAAINAFAEGWSTTIVRALAAKPLSLTELDGMIASLSYPSLERRLAAMRLAGQIEARPSRSRATPYAVTDWLREGVAPLAIASRWERRFNGSHSLPVGRLDVETAFLLTVPRISLPNDLSGACRLGVEMRNGKRPLAGAFVTVDGGRIASCSTRLQGEATAWGLGSVSAWLDATIDEDLGGLELGGDCALAQGLIEALSRTGLATRLDVSTLIGDD